MTYGILGKAIVKVDQKKEEEEKGEEEIEEEGTDKSLFKFNK